MKKRIDFTLVITTVMCLLPMLLSVAVYDKLPDQVAIHFNSAGDPDNYASKAFAAFGLPVMMAFMNLFIHFMLDADPRKANASKTLRLISKWTAPVLTFVLMPITLFVAMGVDVPIEIIVPSFVGLIFIICGNYLPKCKQNYTVGIKLPWTLNNEENWNKTHRMAGYIWMFSGICLVIVSCFNFYPFPILILLLTAMVGGPFVYSYRLHKNGL